MAHNINWFNCIPEIFHYIFHDQFDWYDLINLKLISKNIHNKIKSIIKLKLIKKEIEQKEFVMKISRSINNKIFEKKCWYTQTQSGMHDNMFMMDSKIYSISGCNSDFT